MAGVMGRTTMNRGRATDERRCSGVWPLAACGDQLGDIHHFRLQLLQAANQTRLAVVRSVQRLPRALFTEMYGFPLTIYALSGWLQSRFPDIDWLAHDSGHLLEMMFGWQANPHFGPFHLLSFAFIGGGFILISKAWRVLYDAQRDGTLAVAGPYVRIRHPQYVGFVLVMLGFMFQWPTLLTLAMFPVLIWMYVRLARSEEAEVRREFGKTYERYAEHVPAFVPRFGSIVRRPA